VIVLDGVAKQQGRGNTAKLVFRDLSITLPSDRRLAVLGTPGSGKSTLISLLAGVEKPNAGTIDRYARLSFPVGFGKSLKSSLSMRQNAKFTARIYGCNPNEVADFVEKLLGMESIYDLVMRKLPAAQRFAYLVALSYAIPFDTYLIDGGMWGPPGQYRASIQALCEARSTTAGIILATPHFRFARQVCDMGAVIVDKRLVLYDDIDDAIEVFQDVLDKQAMKAADVEDADLEEMEGVGEMDENESV
jgi:capsular polysaccharide transport system ATP-binding protein